MTDSDAAHLNPDHLPRTAAVEARDIGEVPAVEVITTVALHLMTAAAVKCGLGDGGEDEADLAEARILINALAALVTGAAPDLGTFHAGPLRDGLRTVQLAFREASVFPDEPGKGPGERFTGPVTG
ncbi:MAG: DUF1844 domain-containing protein [Actinobacteria bacterium]|nr:DUF1844 domain-containing protein [Actinomycetota bacterium]